MPTRILCILDGWGEGDANDPYNAVAKANTPNYDKLRQNCSTCFINASGGAVGLPDGQMGNSEVGHMNIGAGRIVLQDLPMINDAIATGDLAKNNLITHLIDNIGDATIHLCALLSDGGVHGHIDHLIYLANLLTDKGCNVVIHGFGDGRDVSPPTLLGYYQQCHDQLKKAKIVTICGRYYAMDRDHNMERTQKATEAIAYGKGEVSHDFATAIQTQYNNNIFDEFIPPIILDNYHGFHDGDALIALNFRADRMRQLLAVLGDKNHELFCGEKLAYHIGMVDYSDHLNQFYQSLFPPKTIANSFGEYVSSLGLTQLRLAESEKYAHVTFFFNGGVEQEYKGETRILVPSPKVATYDLQPEMSAEKVTDRLVDAILSNDYDVIIVNYANPDMVGHTGNFDAVRQTIEFTDICLGRVIEAIAQTNAQMLLTADHGNAEQMWLSDVNQPHTAHTTNLVPLLLVGGNDGQSLNKDGGILADLTPTLLDMMGHKQPPEMTGKSLLQ